MPLYCTMNTEVHDQLDSICQKSKIPSHIRTKENDRGYWKGEKHELKHNQEKISPPGYSESLKCLKYSR